MAFIFIERVRFLVCPVCHNVIVCSRYMHLELNFIIDKSFLFALMNLSDQRPIEFSNSPGKLVALHSVLIILFKLTHNKLSCCHVQR